MRDLEIIYQCNRIVEMVYAIADRERSTITDTARLEDLIFGRIARYIKGDKDKLKHVRVIERMAYQVVAQVKKEYKREHYELFDEFNHESREDGDEIAFEPIDVLADVESEVLNKETANLLAQDDRLQEKILDLWTLGNTNNALISRVLANSFGGNAESHRRRITRFRESCRDRYYDIVAAV